MSRNNPPAGSAVGGLWWGGAARWCELFLLFHRPFSRACARAWCTTPRQLTFPASGVLFVTCFVSRLDGGCLENLTVYAVLLGLVSSASHLFPHADTLKTSSLSDTRACASAAAAAAILFSVWGRVTQARRDRS